MPSPNKMFGVTASRSQSVEQIIRLQLQTVALKSKREINRSSYNTRGRHLQKKWQREGNSALKSRLNKQIFTPAVGGVGQHWGLLGSSPRVSQSLWRKRGVKGFSEYAFFFSCRKVYIFQKLTFGIKIIISDLKAALVHLSITSKVFAHSDWPVSQKFNDLTCFSVTW